MLLNTPMQWDASLLSLRRKLRDNSTNKEFMFHDPPRNLFLFLIAESGRFRIRKSQKQRNLTIGLLQTNLVHVSKECETEVELSVEFKSPKGVF